MTQSQFITWNAATSDLSHPLTSPMTGTTVTTSPQTILQVVAPVNSKMTVKEWGWDILGALPVQGVQMELLSTGTVSGTVTPGTVANYTDTTGVLSQAQFGTVQSISFGSATGGTAAVNFGGQTVSSIAFNAIASTMQTDLQGLSSIGSGNATVSGTSPYVVTFAGTLATGPQPPLTVTSSLTGGTGPKVTTTLSGFNATSEGTITQSRLLAQKSYPAGWAQQFPLGSEPQVTNGHTLRIRATAGTGTVVVAAYVIWAEGA